MGAIGMYCGITAVVSFILGWRFHHASNTYREWRKTIAAVPILRGLTIASGRSLLIPGAVLVVVVVAAFSF